MKVDNSGLLRSNAVRSWAYILVLAVTSIGLIASCAGVSADNTPPSGTTVASTPVAKKAEGKTPKVGQKAPNFTLNSISGKKIQLSQVAKKGPVVLVMLRGYPGYQCPFCTVQVAELMSKAKQFAAAKTRVLLVYPGPSAGLKAHADEFVQGKDRPNNFDLLLDPDYTFTNLYGLRWNAEGETSYPSTFVLNKKRKVLFAKISRSHGDRAKIDDVLAALPK